MTIPMRKYGIDLRDNYLKASSSFLLQQVLYTVISCEMEITVFIG